MDTTEPRRGASDVVDPDSDHSPASPGNPQELPDDLPKSLDDRRSVPVFQQETEMYDAWQGKRCRPACRCNARAVWGCIPGLNLRLIRCDTDNVRQDNHNSSRPQSLRNPYPSVSPSMTTHTTRTTTPARATWKTATHV